jgi:hypothetical protein
MPMKSGTYELLSLCGYRKQNFTISSATLLPQGRLQTTDVGAGVAAHSQSAPAPLRPNPSLKLTRYGMRCKPGPRHMVHYREPGLQHLPPRAA